MRNNQGWIFEGVQLRCYDIQSGKLKLASPEDLIRGYKAITDATSAHDAAQAYAEIHRFLDEERPPLDVVLATSVNNVIGQLAIDNTRKVTVYSGPDPTQRDRLLRGSGIVMIGNSEGEILAASYDEGYTGEKSVADLVWEQHGDYGWAAFRKVAQGAVLGKLAAEGKLEPGIAFGAYAAIQELLEEHGLVERVDPPHHMGYTILSANGKADGFKDGFTAAGTSGMLATDSILGYMRQHLQRELEIDRLNGWATSRMDEFAGTIDRTVSRFAVARFAGYSVAAFPSDSLDDIVIETGDSMNSGENVH